MRSPESLAKALEVFAGFCEHVQRSSTDTALREAAKTQAAIVVDLKNTLDFFFLNEERDSSLDLPPKAEIFRKPIAPSDEFSQTPLFIIGNRRSGTTLLAYLLNASNGVCALPESFLAGAVAKCDPLMGMAGNARKRLNEPFSKFLRRLGQVVDSVFHDHAARANKSRWVSKELFAANRLPFSVCLCNPSWT
jgi:hypothetical protein